MSSLTSQRNALTQTGQAPSERGSGGTLKRTRLGRQEEALTGVQRGGRSGGSGDGPAQSLVESGALCPLVSDV